MPNLPRKDEELLKPWAIRLDASTICQLRCPTCPTAENLIDKGVTRGTLSAAYFKQLIDTNPWVCEVELSNWGEIFLNPELLQIMEYAYEKGVALHALNGANMNHIKEDVIDGLARYKFRTITCSIDGATPETYAIYRRGGNFESVIENIKKINAAKEKYRSPWPELWWQFIIFEHNQHELQQVYELAASLGMRYKGKLSWEGFYTGENFNPPSDVALLRENKGWISRTEFEEATGKHYLHELCGQLWKLPQINHDGTILGCCVNHWGNFGHVQNGDLLEAINNESMQYAREMLTGKQPPREGIPCTTCKVYLKMAEQGDSYHPNPPVRTWRDSRWVNRFINTFVDLPAWTLLQRLTSHRKTVEKRWERMVSQRWRRLRRRLTGS